MNSIFSGKIFPFLLYFPLGFGFVHGAAVAAHHATSRSTTPTMISPYKQALDVEITTRVTRLILEIEKASNAVGQFSSIGHEATVVNALYDLALWAENEKKDGSRAHMSTTNIGVRFLKKLADTLVERAAKRGNAQSVINIDALKALVAGKMQQTPQGQDNQDQDKKNSEIVLRALIRFELEYFGSLYGTIEDFVKKTMQIAVYQTALQIWGPYGYAEFERLYYKRNKKFFLTDYLADAEKAHYFEGYSVEEVLAIDADAFAVVNGEENFKINLFLNNRYITNLFGLSEVVQDPNIAVCLLDLSNNEIDSLPDEVMSVINKTDIQEMNLSHNRLSSFDIEKINNDRLSILVLSHNKLSQWPSDAFMEKNAGLKTLMLGENNDITGHYPDYLKRLVCLQLPDNSRRLNVLAKGHTRTKS